MGKTLLDNRLLDLRRPGRCSHTSRNTPINKLVSMFKMPKHLSNNRANRNSYNSRNRNCNLNNLRCKARALSCNLSNRALEDSEVL